MKLYIGHKGDELNCLAFDTGWGCGYENDIFSMFLELDGSICSDNYPVSGTAGFMGDLHFTELEITTEQLVKMVGLVVGGGKI